MPLRSAAASLALVALIALAPRAVTAAEPPFATITEKRGAFDDVVFDVRQAITQAGFSVDATSHVGDMLARTAKDVGATKEVYKSAVGLQFCSVRLSRAMFEADPTTIALCPSVIVVYELAGRPGVVHVGYRRLPEIAEGAAREAIDAQRRMLDAIVKEATQ